MFLAVSRNNDLYSRPSRSVTITPWQLQKPATDPETPKGCFCFWGLKLAALKNLKMFVQLILLQTSQSTRAWKHTGGVSFSGCHRVIVADLETQEDDPVNCVNWEMKKIKMFCLNLKFSGAGLNIGHRSCLQLHPIAFSLHMLGYEVVGWLEK